MTGTTTPTRPTSACDGHGCGSYDPGHDTHWIQARLALCSDDGVPVLLAADGEGSLRLTGERVDVAGTYGVDVVGRHHEPDRVAEALALAASGAMARLDVPRHALRVIEPGGRTLVLNLELAPARG